MNPFHNTSRKAEPDEHAAELGERYIGDSRCSQGRMFPPKDEGFMNGRAMVVIICLSILGWFFAGWVISMVRRLA